MKKIIALLVVLGVMFGGISVHTATSAKNDGISFTKKVFALEATDLDAKKGKKKKDTSTPAGDKKCEATTCGNMEDPVMCMCNTGGTYVCGCKAKAGANGASSTLPSH